MNISMKVVYPLVLVGLVVLGFVLQPTFTTGVAIGVVFMAVVTLADFLTARRRRDAGIRRRTGTGLAERRD
jgi:hypothetical protein